jgi:hypothetical protein
MRAFSFQNRSWLAVLFLMSVFFFSFPVSVLAIGISPPSFELGTIAVNQMETVGLWVVRSLDEGSAAVNLLVSARKNGGPYFQGASSVTIPEGSDKVWYSFNVVPDFASAGPFEMFVDFHLVSSSGGISGAGTSVITGATAVVTFDTEVLPTTSSGGGSSSGGGTSTKKKTETEPESETQEDEATSDTESEPTSEDEVSQDQAAQDEVSPNEDSQSLSEDVEDQTQNDVEEPSRATPEEIVTDLDVSEEDSAQESDEDNEVVLAEIPQIGLKSFTHPKDNVYYTSRRLLISWAPLGVSQQAVYRYVLNSSETASVSDLVFETTYPQMTFDLQEDGEYFLHVMGVNDQGVSEIFTKRILIDTKPPQVLLDSVREKTHWYSFSTYSLHLNAIDALSGLSDLRVIDGLEIFGELQDGVIQLPTWTFGSFPLVIEAMDQAGNIVQKSFTVHLTPRYPLPSLLTKFLSLFDERL